jgi:hypothetical protein
MDPGQNLAYSSYYAGGMRVFRFGEAGIEEVGHYIDDEGSNFWGVETFVPSGARSRRGPSGSCAAGFKLPPASRSPARSRARAGDRGGLGHVSPSWSQARTACPRSPCRRPMTPRGERPFRPVRSRIRGRAPCFRPRNREARRCRRGRVRAGGRRSRARSRPRTSSPRPKPSARSGSSAGNSISLNGERSMARTIALALGGAGGLRSSPGLAQAQLAWCDLHALVRADELDRQPTFALV